MNPRRILVVIGVLVLACLGCGLLAQVIPYGHNHTNPPVVQEPPWDSPQTRALAVRACFDCHSNETVWKWYSNIAPASWLVQRDVDEGRDRLNFSNWSSGQVRRAREAPETVLQGSMPPVQYLILHPEAVLSAQEKQQLADGLQASLR